MTLDEYFGTVNYDLLDHTAYKKLSELKLIDIMVPFDCTVKKALEIESNYKLGYDIKYAVIGDDGKPVIVDSGDKDHVEILSVSYPYSDPAMPEYINKDPNTISEHELGLWRDALNSRLYPLVYNSRSKAYIEEFDHDDKLGAFLHAYTGEIEPFEYNKLSSIQTIISPEKLPHFMHIIKRKNRKLSTVEWYAMLSDLYDSDEYRLIYQFNYNNDYPNGDIFNNNHEYTMFTPSSLTWNQNAAWSEYIRSMIELKAKVIMVP